jgi:chorismate-pyruvate lyase
MQNTLIRDLASPAIARIFAAPGLPLTLLLEEAASKAAGELVTVTITVLHRDDRVLRSVQAESLNVADADAVPGHYRTGQLRAGADILAYTEATVRLGLLPGGTRELLAGDTPLGKILHALGARREPVAAEILYGGRLRIRACMRIGDQVVAAVSELITPHAVSLLAAC